MRVKVVKNKVAAPFKQAEFDIEFGKGISTSGCLIDYGLEHNIVTKSGSFFSYGEERLGQGRGNAKAFLDEHPETAKEIEAKIYAALGIGRDLVKPIEPREEPAPPAVEPASRRGRRGRAASLVSARRRAGASDPVERDARSPTATWTAATAPRHEVRRHLAGKGNRADAVDRAGDRDAARAGFVDDARFARLFAEDKRTLEQWGAERIRTALLARGVERDLIEAALAGDGEPGSELERALALLSRRFPDAAAGSPRPRRALGVLYARAMTRARARRARRVCARLGSCLPNKRSLASCELPVFTHLVRRN